MVDLQAQIAWLVVMVDYVIHTKAVTHLRLHPMLEEEEQLTLQ
jgi:hypothetical protein